jgi:tRNA-dihydrouridine synthase
VNTPFFILAPMDDVTDVVFRSIVSDCAKPDMFMTEFVNVDGLQSRGRKNIIHKLMIDRKTDHHIIAQIWGRTPENYEKCADEIVDMGFDGVDINMGCPVKNVAGNGCCSALINKRDLAHEIIEATKRGAAGRIPVSVKTRLGFSVIDLTWHEFLLGHNLNMLSVHLRTRKEMSKVPAHFEYAKQLVELRDRIAPNTKLVINGDIMDREQGLQLAAESGADGIMIGRGVFKNPFCFAEAGMWESKTPKDRIEIYLTQVLRFKETWQDRQRNFQSLKRYAKIYVADFENAAEIRDACMRCEEIGQLIAVLKSHIALYEIG